MCMARGKWLFPGRVHPNGTHPTPSWQLPMACQLPLAPPPGPTGYCPAGLPLRAVVHHPGPGHALLHGTWLYVCVRACLAQHVCWEGGGGGWGGEGTGAGTPGAAAKCMLPVRLGAKPPALCMHMHMQPHCSLLQACAHVWSALPAQPGPLPDQPAPLPDHPPAKAACVCTLTCTAWEAHGAPQARAGAGRPRRRPGLAPSCSPWRRPCAPPFHHHPHPPPLPLHVQWWERPATNHLPLAPPPAPCAAARSCLCLCARPPAGACGHWRGHVQGLERSQAAGRRLLPRHVSRALCAACVVGMPCAPLPSAEEGGSTRAACASAPLPPQIVKLLRSFDGPGLRCALPYNPSCLAWSPKPLTPPPPRTRQL